MLGFGIITRSVRLAFESEPHKNSTINTNLMKGATSRKPSSEDNNENEAMEMSNLKLATDESISNYSSTPPPDIKNIYFSFS